MMADHISLELLFTPYRKVESEAKRTEREPDVAESPF